MTYNYGFDVVYIGTPFSDLHNNHKGRGVYPFYDIPKYRLHIPRPIILPNNYPSNPKSIGEHIRKHRIDQGLLQSDVANIIGVNEGSIWNWEHGTEPKIKYMPKIIEFLGYVPFDSPSGKDILDKLKYFKLVNGLGYRQLGKVMGKDPDQLLDWLNGSTKPGLQSIKIIESFLSKSDYCKKGMFSP